MGKATWNEELSVVVLCQLDGDMLSIGWRAFTNVDSYVEHSATHAAHEFALRIGRTLKMKTAHHTIGRHRFVVLTEIDMTNFLVKLTL